MKPGTALEDFAMERLQSTWENRVDWNVSESGVHPLRVEELVDDPAAVAALMSQSLGYPQTNGTIELRRAIAAMYPGATPDHVEVTNGGSEANCLALMHLVEPGDEVVMMTPNYMQVRGLSRWLGATVKAWPLVPGAHRWHVDLESLSALVGNRTKAILICNPNNPTGARIAPAEVDGICRVAARVGAWVVSDEIYRGAELDGVETATVWGRAERALVTSGLSKAYGLPGLRIGWVAGPPAVVDTLWGIHDYTSIAPGAINDRLARIALAPARREQLLARTRGILRAELSDPARLAGAARAAPIPRRSGGGSHRLHPLSPRDQLDALHRAPARRAQRARGPGRSLRDGRLPAHWFRNRRVTPFEQPRADRLAARHDPIRRLRCSLISPWSASVTSGGALPG